VHTESRLLRRGCSTQTRLQAPQPENALSNLQNRLIELLPRRDRQALLAIASPVDLAMSDVLAEPGKRTSHVYFPTGAAISVVTAVSDGHALEVAMVGREGMLGIHLNLGVRTASSHALVHDAGTAWRVSTSAYLDVLANNPGLQQVLGRYADVLSAQLSLLVACVRFHEIEPRLARRLLMAQDRAGRDTFHVTQELLGYVLGVRRVGVTRAASTLQRSGLIEYRRGVMTVLNRKGLEKAACTCYRADCEAYAKTLA
jgi:CRP-like cAMP-binding protein